MNRRHFLALGSAATAALLFDPERLLWVPGARTFFIPDKTVVEAKTMADVVHGLVALLPSGDGRWYRAEVMLGREDFQRRLAHEMSIITAMGGRVVQWLGAEPERQR
jgi:hypothetical protein